MSAWAGSTRRRRLPSNWEAIRAKVKARAHGRCEALAHVPDCDRIGTQCDHIKAGDDHSMRNLQWISAPCHAAKTRADNGGIRPVNRPPEPHPGSLGGGGDTPATPPRPGQIGRAHV